jgi:mRNA interferase HicA
VSETRQQARKTLGLDFVIRTDYTAHLTANELKRWLKKQGCTFTEGTRHSVALLGGKKTTIPRHPSTEIKKNTLHTILRDLGLRK